MRNFEKERDKRRLEERTIELSKTLRKSGMSSIIYLPECKRILVEGKEI